MARIVGGIGIAHTPSMGMEYDRGLREGFAPAWARWHEGTRPVHAWLQRLRPTQMVVVYNDHLNHFDFRAYPTFALGIGDTFPQADEGWGPRPLPPLAGTPALGIHLAEHLVREEDFDLTVCHEMALDHGVYSWVPYLFDASHEAPWPVPITPIAVNMVRQPLPTGRRLRRLGEALRRGIERWDADERVLVVATGGMSHQISGARFGATNPAFDQQFLARLPDHLDELVALPQEDYMRLGGSEAAELTLWFAMRAALSAQARAVYDYYTVPQITACGVLAMEEPDVR